MAKTLSLTAAAYKLVWVRIFLFIALPYVATFISETEDYSTQAWQELGAFRKARIHLKCLFPGMLAFVAFMDKSLTRGDEKYEELKVEGKAEAQEEKADKAVVVAAARAEDRKDAVAGVAATESISKLAAKRRGEAESRDGQT